MLINSCPHCGDAESGFVVRGKVVGPTKLFFSAEGDYVEAYDDYVKHIHRGVVRCGKCDRIRKDLTADGWKVILRV